MMPYFLLGCASKPTTSFNSLGSRGCTISSTEVDVVSLGGSGESCLCVSPLPAGGCSRFVWYDMKLHGRQTHMSWVSEGFVLKRC
jgi:hypothetical protein